MNLDEKYVYYITTINSAIEKFIISNNKHPMEIIIPNRIFEFLKLYCENNSTKFDSSGNFTISGIPVCSANDRMWTSFDDTRTFIANGKYGKQFLAFNYKATNDWMGVHHLAFLLNVYMNPMIKRALNSKGLEIDKSVDEQYAISTLIQWIFRSAVRVHEPIKLYLPSSRMRNLLERWKQGEFDNEVLENE